MHRSLKHVLPLLLLLGCGRADAPAASALDEVRGAALSGARARLAGDPLGEGASVDTFRDPVAGVITRFDGAPRAPRLLRLRPMTTDSEILFGDPAVEGQPFVIRIRELAGTRIPPHSHPVDEHITVLQGTWYFGLGEIFDSTKLQALPAGSYAFVPAGTTMFAYAPEPAIVQVHGTGSFDTHWEHGMTTLEDPGADAVFRFRLGQTVRTPRGEGRIVWGGASGTLIQYQLEGADGSLFLVQEHQVRRP